MTQIAIVGGKNKGETSCHTGDEMATMSPSASQVTLWGPVLLTSTCKNFDFCFHLVSILICTCPPLKNTLVMPSAFSMSIGDPPKVLIFTLNISDNLQLGFVCSADLIKLPDFFCGVFGFVHLFNCICLALHCICEMDNSHVINCNNLFWPQILCKVDSQNLGKIE